MKNIKNFKKFREELDKSKKEIKDRPITFNEICINQFIILSKLQTIQSLLFCLFKNNNIPIVDEDGNEISFDEYCSLIFDSTFLEISKPLDNE